MKRVFLFLLLTLWAFSLQAGVKSVKTTKVLSLSNQYVDVYTAYITPSQTNSVLDTVLIYAPSPDGGAGPFRIEALGDTVVSVMTLFSTTSTDSIRFNYVLRASYKPSPTITSTKALHPDWVRLFTTSQNRAVATADDSASFMNNLPFKRRDAATTSLASGLPLQFHLQYCEDAALNSIRPFNIYIVVPKRSWPVGRTLQ